MLTNIKLGCQDIKKNVKFILLTTMFLVILSFISMVILHTVTMLSVDSNPHYPISYEIVYSEYEFQSNPSIVEELSQIFDENAVSYQYSNSLSEINNYPINVLFGNPEILGFDRVPDFDIVAFSSGYLDLNSIQYNGVEIPVEKVPNQSLELTESSVYIVFNGDALKEVLKSYYEHDFTYIISVLENTYMMSSDLEAKNSFESIVNGIKGIELKGRFDSDFINSDSNFVYYYLVPLFLIIFFVFIISYLNLQKEMILKKQKELIIHSLHGATFCALAVRFMISIFLPISVSYLISLYLARGLEHGYLLLASYYGAITFFMLVYIIAVLKSTNINKNIRGDLQ